MSRRVRASFQWERPSSQDLRALRRLAYHRRSDGIALKLLDDERGEFDVAGEVIADVSSREETGRRSRRWSSEKIICARESGSVSYFLYEVGHTTVSGEVDRHKVQQCSSGREVYDAIVGRRRLTAMDTDLLEQATVADAEFARTLGDAHEVEDLSPSVSALVLDPDIREFTLDRDGDRALRFRGVELAQEPSRRPDAAAWMQVALYRTIDGRYVVQKCRYRAGDDVPDKSAVAIVKDGPAALEWLSLRRAGWVHSAILDALRAAAQRDRAFAGSLGDLLEGTNFRRYVDEVPTLSDAQRRVLALLQNGAHLRVRSAHLPEPVGWEPPATTAWLPHPRVVLALSRSNLIRKEPSRDPNSRETLWSISERGLAALQQADGRE